MLNKVNNLPMTLTVYEVANILRINKTKAYELSHREDFSSTKLGNRIIIPRDAFLRWMDKVVEKLRSVSKESKGKEVYKFARPTKTGLEYFPLDVDIDRDDAVFYIEAKYGLIGFAALIRLYMRIYNYKGYYYNCM